MVARLSLLNFRKVDREIELRPFTFMVSKSFITGSRRMRSDTYSTPPLNPESQITLRPTITVRKLSVKVFCGLHVDDTRSVTKSLPCNCLRKGPSYCEYKVGALVRHFVINLFVLAIIYSRGPFYYLTLLLYLP